VVLASAFCKRAEAMLTNEQALEILHNNRDLDEKTRALQYFIAQPNVLQNIPKTFIELFRKQKDPERKP
jgi:hypothetical protein